MKKGRHRRFEEARELKQSNEVDVDAIFRIDELLETGDDDESVRPEHASWYDEFDGEAGDKPEAAQATDADQPAIPDAVPDTSGAADPADD